MKFTRQGFLTVLAVLNTLSGKLLALPFKSSSSLSKPTPPRTPSRMRPWLGDWREIKRVPVFVSVHPTAQRLIVAALRHEMLTLRYWGGSTPGVTRHVSPKLVFQAGGYGPLYVSGYCHLRRQERVFRVDRVEFTEDDGIVCITE
jgi:hypothetical protein